jgi:O-methyltransferase
MSSDFYTQQQLWQQVGQISVNDGGRLNLLLAEARRQAFYGDGDFIEMGVYRGGTALLLAHAIAEQGSSAQLHLLDSWQGMPPPRPEDGQPLVGQGFFADASEAGVRQALAAFGFLAYSHTYPGWFEDTLPARRGPFALAHVDCDFYEPIRSCLAHVLPRMTARGAVIVDDFGDGEPRSFPGVERGVREAIAGTEWRLLPLGGLRDQSVILLRGPLETDALTLI